MFFIDISAFATSQFLLARLKIAFCGNANGKSMGMKQRCVSIWILHILIHTIKPYRHFGTQFAGTDCVEPLCNQHYKMKQKLNLDEYARFFNDSALWTKIKRVARKAGIKAVYYALLLYYVSTDPAVPRTEKLKIYGALGYFILPIDLIPDTIIGLGFTDDLAALAWALFAVQKYITPETERRARTRLREWFGDFDDDDLPDFKNDATPDADGIIDVEVIE